MNPERFANTLRGVVVEGDFVGVGFVAVTTEDEGDLQLRVVVRAAFTAYFSTN